MISEGVQVPPRPLIKTNHQGNQIFLLVINAAAEEEKKIITIIGAVKLAGVNIHNKTFMSMPGGRP